MRPKKYPYLGAKKAKKTTQEDKLELVAFPNIAIKKDLLKYVHTVVSYHSSASIIYFRIPKVFGLGYDEQKAKVNLSYEETIKILNSY